MKKLPFVSTIYVLGIWMWSWQLHVSTSRQIMLLRTLRFQGPMCPVSHSSRWSKQGWNQDLNPVWARTPGTWCYFVIKSWASEGTNYRLIIQSPLTSFNKISHTWKSLSDTENLQKERTSLFCGPLAFIPVCNTIMENAWPKCGCFSLTLARPHDSLLIAKDSSSLYKVTLFTPLPFPFWRYFFGRYRCHVNKENQNWWCFMHLTHWYGIPWFRVAVCLKRGGLSGPVQVPLVWMVLSHHKVRINGWRGEHEHLMMGYTLFKIQANKNTNNFPGSLHVNPVDYFTVYF